ncbi:MAG: CAP domain-containing protein [Firmicutes bacterium]|nr:CAP domain-containing protein [Bacillota bacterium]
MKHIVKYAVVLCMLMGMILPVQAFAGCDAAGWTESSTGGDQAAWQTKWNCGNWASCLKNTGKECTAQKENCFGGICKKDQNTRNTFFKTCTNDNCKLQKDCTDGSCGADQNCTDGSCDADQNCAYGSCDASDADLTQKLPGQAEKEPQAEVEKPRQPEASRQETPKNTASEQKGSQAQQILALVNQKRNAQGLNALVLNDELSAVAQAKAEDMAAKGYFSHTSPTYGSPFDMMKSFGINYTAAGENIAKGYSSASSVMDGWMNSEGHRANILNTNFTQLGVGYYVDGNGTAYWVQMFIR